MLVFFFQDKVYAAGSLRKGSSLETTDLSLPRIQIRPISEWKIVKELLSKVKNATVPAWGKIGKAGMCIFIHLRVVCLRNSCFRVRLLFNLFMYFV